MVLYINSPKVVASTVESICSISTCKQKDIEMYVHLSKQSNQKEGVDYTEQKKAKEEELRSIKAYK